MLSGFTVSFDSVLLAAALPAPCGCLAKKGDSHRFSCCTIVGNNGVPRARIGLQSPIFARAHFRYGLIGRLERRVPRLAGAVAAHDGAGEPKSSSAASTTPPAMLDTGDNQQYGQRKQNRELAVDGSRNHAKNITGPASTPSRRTLAVGRSGLGPMTRSLARMRMSTPNRVWRGLQASHVNRRPRSRLRS